eukprot:TRINITY_DN1665_c0_g2_i1.p1 TRINITY_DN1665_c0_g2~~TRINITY_DN1665_c0_g2_i1.p1  ORF type:complete len:480 (+),score=113.28 TRINITY_DN1665_c0_g2_i1:1-1440(+)
MELNNDVVRLIFRLLDVFDLGRSALVCKQWNACVTMDHWDTCYNDLVQRHGFVRERLHKSSKDYCIEFATVQRNVRLGRFRVEANMDKLNLNTHDPLAVIPPEMITPKLKTLIITANYFVMGDDSPTVRIIHRYDNQAEIRILPNIPEGTRLIEDAELPDYIAIVRTTEMEFIDLRTFQRWIHPGYFRIAYISRARAPVLDNDNESLKMFDLFLGKFLWEFGKGHQSIFIQGNRAVALTPENIITYDAKTGRKLAEISRENSQVMIGMSILFILGNKTVQLRDVDTGDMLLTLQLQYEVNYNLSFPTNAKFQGNLIVMCGPINIDVDFKKYQVEKCVVVFPNGKMEQMDKRSVEMHRVLYNTMPNRITSYPIEIRDNVRLFASYERSGKLNPIMSRFHTMLVHQDRDLEFPIEVITDGAPMSKPGVFHSQIKCFGYIDRDRPEGANNFGTIVFWKEEKMDGRWMPTNLTASELQLFKTR